MSRLWPHGMCFTDTVTGPTFDWTATTSVALRTSEASLLPTLPGVGSPIDGGPASPTSTSGVGSISLNVGFPVSHFVLFTLVWRFHN